MAPGRVSVRSWLALLNFKANHRKLAVFDDPDSGELAAMVMSANPHDGSSAHRNMAWRVQGPVVRDLLEAERLLPGLAAIPSALQTVELMLESAATASDQNAEPLATLALANESAIRNIVLEATAALGAGDEINLEMFYLSDRKIIAALGAAAERGVAVRTLLDVNSDAFGRAKNGVPNRPVAHELEQRGVDVRWCATAGEQCHVKWFHARKGDRHTVVAGSGNFTRRNLADLNLESDLVLRTRTGDRSLEKMLTRFEKHWRNEAERTYSVPYSDFSDDSLWLTMQYRAMEATGLGTF
jgi:phosphatidylserine/phosphatidylglycerophosphate/cardiolipin synthase-like enzyme